MENFITYTSIALALALVAVLVRAMQFLTKKEKKKPYKRSVRDKTLSVLLLLFILAVPVFFRFVSFGLDKELLSLYESRWLSYAVNCCISGLCIMASFFIAERKLIFFDALKHATHLSGKFFMWFVSVWSIMWGIFIIVAPLLFDVSLPKGKCFF